MRCWSSAWMENSAGRRLMRRRHSCRIRQEGPPGFDCRSAQVLAGGAMQFRSALLVAVSLFSSAVTAQTVPGSLDMRWQEGAADCKSATAPPLQVHRYDDRTFILRENLCTTFEAPFLYLLVGSAEALLIDTGDVADPRQVPLADTVTKLMPPGLKLLV